LADSADSIDRAALDAGAVGSNSSFWTLCAERFNKGFPVDSVDGPLFADKVHFSHPTIAGHPEAVTPSQRGTFSSADVRIYYIYYLIRSNAADGQRRADG
jgi:hypothetical protein